MRSSTIVNFVLGIVGIVLALLEAWAFWNDRYKKDAADTSWDKDTISEQIWEWINASSFTRLAAAILCGHLFGQSDDFPLETRFKAWINSKPVLIFAVGFLIGRWFWQKVHHVAKEGA